MTVSASLLKHKISSICIFDSKLASGRGVAALASKLHGVVNT